MEAGRLADPAAAFVLRRWAAPATAVLAFVLFSVLSVFAVSAQQAQGCDTTGPAGAGSPVAGPSGANENDV